MSPGEGEELSGNEQKIYRTLKELGFTTEEKLGTAERITQASKLPKNMAMNVLQSLQEKGWVRRKARNQAVGYYTVK